MDSHCVGWSSSIISPCTSTTCHPIAGGTKFASRKLCGKMSTLRSCPHLVAMKKAVIQSYMEWAIITLAIYNKYHSIYFTIHKNHYIEPVKVWAWKRYWRKRRLTEPPIVWARRQVRLHCRDCSRQEFLEGKINKSKKDCSRWVFQQHNVELIQLLRRRI